MKEAGLTSLPGGGAEVFSTAVRATIAERKLTGEEWLRVHRVAHELGIPTNCTMLYGHVETAEDRIQHLSMLRELQDDTGGFLTYIPLAYHPDHNELGEEMGRVGTATTGYEDLKNIAVGPAVPGQHSPRKDPLADGHARSSPRSRSASAATTWRERWSTSGSITRPAPTRPCILPYMDLVHLIRGAGKRPVERDSLYQTRARELRRLPPHEPSAASGGARLAVVHAA